MSQPKVVREGTKAVVTPEGDLIASTAPAFSTQVKELIQGGVKDLVVDLSASEMLDSTGIGTLIACHKTVSRVGGKLSVIHASMEISDLLVAMRIDQIISIA